MPSPEFYAARANEEKNRLEAYLPWAAPLLGCPVVPLRWCHLIELSRAGNAFFTSAEPTRDDVFDLLWRLNPAFRRPDGDTPNAGFRKPGRLRSWAQRRLIQQLVRHTSANSVEFTIRRRLDEAFQDRPHPPKKPGESTEYISPLRVVPTWFDYVASECFVFGHSREEILDYSVAWTFQMLRVQGIKAGREDDYIPKSAALIGPAPAPSPEASTN